MHFRIHNKGNNKTKRNYENSREGVSAVEEVASTSDGVRIFHSVLECPHIPRAEK